MTFPNFLRQSLFGIFASLAALGTGCLGFFIFRGLVGTAEFLVGIAPPPKDLFRDLRLVWVFFMGLGFLSVVFGGFLLPKKRSPYAAAVACSLMMASSMPLFALGFELQMEWQAVLLGGALAASGFFLPRSMSSEERTQPEKNLHKGCGCIGAPMVFLIFSVVLMVELWGCPSGRAGDWEKEGNQHANAAFAYYLKHGHAPEDIRDAGVILEGYWRTGWKYNSSDDLLFLELRFSDYGACGWELSWHFNAFWDDTSETLNQEVQLEALELFDFVLVYKLAHDAYPLTMEELGLEKSWGDHGPWSLAPSTEKSEQSLRFRGRPIPWSSIRHHALAEDPIGQEVITYRDHGWYHDS